MRNSACLVDLIPPRLDGLMCSDAPHDPPLLPVRGAAAGVGTSGPPPYGVRIERVRRRGTTGAASRLVSISSARPNRPCASLTTNDGCIQISPIWTVGLFHDCWPTSADCRLLPSYGDLLAGRMRPVRTERHESLGRALWAGPGGQSGLRRGAQPLSNAGTIFEMIDDHGR